MNLLVFLVVSFSLICGLNGMRLKRNKDQQNVCNYRENIYHPNPYVWLPSVRSGRHIKFIWIDSGKYATWFMNRHGYHFPAEFSYSDRPDLYISAFGHVMGCHYRCKPLQAFCEASMVAKNHTTSEPAENIKNPKQTKPRKSNPKGRKNSGKISKPKKSNPKGREKSGKKSKPRKQKPRGRKKSDKKSKPRKQEPRGRKKSGKKSKPRKQKPRGIRKSDKKSKPRKQKPRGRKKSGKKSKPRKSKPQSRKSNRKQSKSEKLKSADGRKSSKKTNQSISEQTKGKNATSYPVSECPQGFEKFKKHCFYLSKEKLSFSDAKKTCKQMGGYQVWISDKWNTKKPKEKIVRQYLYLCNYRGNLYHPNPYVWLPSVRSGRHIKFIWIDSGKDATWFMDKHGYHVPAQFSHSDRPDLYISAFGHVMGCYYRCKPLQAFCEASMVAKNHTKANSTDRKMKQKRKIDSGEKEDNNDDDYDDYK
ncbi:uncharacterized protein LOC123556043 isoform X2 [Mercenaria mercenaria]|uniref:uncharacterized protein LOC123556043 isoform X2 n=1 Tax=Mercenaria mercenaria TaxID=6596 RepID=UPI00234F5036|nr:uncharacterized protein LOC123556043 isoform X2 [Mercenaria mercenaria]